ncbi:MAG: hypothetical protein ACHQVS_01710 [Candidatus Babeliales bacterium]
MMHFFYLVLLLMVEHAVFASDNHVPVHTTSYWTHDDDIPLVCRIQRRYYLIKRLEKPTHLIGKLKNYATHEKMAILAHVAQDMARMPLRHSVCRSLQTTCTIASFDAVWSDFLSYKYIDDDRFDKEVVIVVLLLYKHMLVSLLDRTDEALELAARIDAYIAMVSHRAEYALEEVLEVDVDTAAQETTSYAPLLHELLLGHTAWSDFYSDAKQNMQATLGTLVHVLDTTTQEPVHLVVANAVRLYHIQRMLKALFILSHHTQKPMHVSQLSEKIKTPIVRDCVQHIEKTRSLLPLFQLWQRIICYDFIHDTHEVKEFMRVVVIMYKSIACCMQQERAVPDHDILALYDQIAALEIGELLDLLDDVATQVDHISHVYELNNADLSWSVWFKKYWWVVPVVAAWVYLTIAKHAAAQHVPKVI